MADIRRSCILGLVVEVNPDEEHSRQATFIYGRIKPLQGTSLSGDESQEHLGPSDDEEPAPVPDFADFPTGDTPRNGKWGLTKKEQHAADLVHRQEQNVIKRQEYKQTKKRAKKSLIEETGALTLGIPALTSNVPATAMTYLTTSSLNLGLKSLEFSVTTPSISTRLADMYLIGGPHNRKRKRRQDTNKRHFENNDDEADAEGLGTIEEEAEAEARKATQTPVTPQSAYVESSAGDATAAPAPNAPAYAFTYTVENAPKQSPGSCTTYPSSISHPIRGKIYVDTAIQTEPTHICIGDCQCPIWVTPKSATAAPAKPRVRKVPPHVAHMHRMMALKREADARRDAKLKEAGLELPKFDPKDPGKVVFYEKKALESGGYELLKQEWRNGKRIE